MKEYNKLMRAIKNMKLFTITKTTRKTTVKLTHIDSGKLYSIHPGDNAVKPLQKWLKQFNR